MIIETGADVILEETLRRVVTPMLDDIKASLTHVEDDIKASLTRVEDDIATIKGDVSRVRYISALASS